MSGLFKGIGKIFKKAVKVVKKVALPVLAVGAAVLTGGAALGLALPSLGGVAGSIGLSSMSGVLTAAGQGAALGMAGAALTGKNPIKGATAGFMTGGLVGAATGGLGAAASPAAGASQAANDGILVTRGASAPLSSVASGSGFSGAALAPAATGAATTSPALVQAGGTAARGGFMGFLERNPIISGNLIAGVGQGLAASEQAKAERKENRRQEANFEADGWVRPIQFDPSGLSSAGQYFEDRIRPKKAVYDPATGRIDYV